MEFISDSQVTHPFRSETLCFFVIRHFWLRHAQKSVFYMSSHISAWNIIGDNYWLFIVVFIYTRRLSISNGIASRRSTIIPQIGVLASCWVQCSIHVVWIIINIPTCQWYILINAFIGMPTVTHQKWYKTWCHYCIYRELLNICIRQFSHFIFPWNNLSFILHPIVWIEQREFVAVTPVFHNRQNQTQLAFAMRTSLLVMWDRYLWRHVKLQRAKRANHTSEMFKKFWLGHRLIPLKENLITNYHRICVNESQHVVLTSHGKTGVSWHCLRLHAPISSDSTDF